MCNQQPPDAEVDMITRCFRHQTPEAYGRPLNEYPDYNVMNTQRDPEVAEPQYAGYITTRGGWCSQCECDHMAPEVVVAGRA